MMRKDLPSCHDDTNDNQVFAMAQGFQRSQVDDIDLIDDIEAIESQGRTMAQKSRGFGCAAKASEVTEWMIKAE